MLCQYDLATLLESLSQESVSLKIDNDLLSNTTKPTLLDSLSQDYVFLEYLSNTTKLTLLDSLLQEDSVTKVHLATCLIRPSLHCLNHYVKSLFL